MNHSTTRELSTYDVMGTDGELGEISDVYFDDQSWKVRYLVVDTNSWLPGGKVLLSPASLLRTDTTAKTLQFKLTKEQIKQCPGVEDKPTVTRQMEQALADYYGWPVYWAMPTLPPATLAFTQYPGLLSGDEYEAILEKLNDRRDVTELTLRSFDEVKGYSLLTAAQETATLEDLIIDINNWEIPYLIVGKGGLLRREGAAVPTLFVDNVHWANRTVSLLVSGKTISDAPRVSFDGVANDAEEALLKYYFEQSRDELLGVSTAAVGK